MLVQMTVSKNGRVADAVYSDGIFLLAGEQIITLSEEYAIQVEITCLTPSRLNIGYVMSGHFDSVEII